MNRKRGLLAVVMALAMVFAATTFVVGEADASVSQDEKTATVTTSTEFDAAVTGAEGYESVEKIVLGADVTPTSTAWAKAVSIDGKGYKITLAATIYINAEVGFKDVKFENKYSTDATEDEPADKYASYEIYTNVNGDITFTGCEFVGDENNEHAVTITYGGSATFDDVKFNGKTVTVDDIGTVEFKNGCSDLDLNLVDSDGTVTLGTNVIIDAATAQGAIVNLAYADLNLGGKEWTFKSINDRKGESEISNGTLKNTSFGTYDGVPGDYRKSDVKLDKVNLSGITDLAASNGKVVSLGGNFTLAKGATLDIDAGCKLVGATVTGNGSIATVTATAGASGLTVKSGSLTFTGSVSTTELSIATSSEDVILENVVITGTGNGTETITLSGIEIRGSVTVPEEVNIVATNGITINENSTLNIGGVINGNIENNGALVLTSENAGVAGGNTVTGTGTVDASGIASEGTISGSFDTDTEFTKNQIITATGDVTLVDGTDFKFSGTLIIPEGVTVTVEEGASLKVLSYTGKLENNGTIVVKGTFAIEGGEAENNGTIVVENDDATAKMTIGANLVNNGTISIGEETEAKIQGNLVNNGIFESEGKIQAVFRQNTIYNYAEFVLSGTIDSGMTIYLMSTEASVDFDGVAVKASQVVRVSDSKYADESKTFNDLADASTVSIATGSNKAVDGLTVTLQLVKDPAITTSSVYKKELVLSGAVTAVDKNDEPVEDFIITISTSGETSVPGELSISKNIQMTVGGTMNVAGTIGYTIDDDVTGEGFTVTGALDVTGTVSGNDEAIGGEDKVNAVKYVIEKTSITPDMYHYTTLAAAAESGAKELEVLGKIDVGSDVTIADGVTLDNSTGGITVGKDAKLIMATGSKLKNNANAIAQTETTPACGILVKGTMYIEDVKKTFKALSGIVSEVQTIGENDATFTSLANALSIATDGDVIKLSGNAEIKADTTIPAGVTVDTNDKTLKVTNDTTLAVDGTLLLKTGGALILVEADTTTTPAKEAGEVVLNGKIESPVGITNPIAGAYYSITEKGKITYYVEPVANAAPKIATVDAYTMTVNAFDGELKVGAVSFAGTSDAAVNVKVVGKLAGDITLDLATISFDGKAFKGTVTNGTGTIAVDGIATNTFNVKSTAKDDVKALTVSGTFNVGTNKTVTASGDAVFSEFNAGDVTVDGNVKVAKAGTIGTLTVNGAVTVDNGVILNVTDIEVLGAVTVAEADTAASKLAGTLKVTGDAYLGITGKDVTGAAASLAGKAVVDGQMFVAAGSTFPEDMVEDVPYVELCIEGKTWITVYDFADKGTVTIRADVIENADVTGWVDDKGKSVATKNSDGDYVIDVIDGKASATIDYDIYTVTFVKATGINDVYVDGVLVNGFVKVDAGEHKVSYTLANGYTGEAKMLVDGKEVSGLSFTVGGDVLAYEITLQGIEKAPAEVGGGDAPTVVEKDEGMSLTDILLIVLVVLIVIMAVIVALRMMRS